MAGRRGSGSHPISAPNFESNHIHRPRLVDRLLAAHGARVSLVVASAGYGKTTLLSDFNRLSPDPVSWLRLSEADRDLLTLAGLVWASLERRFYRLRGDLDVNRMDGLAPRAVGRRIARVLAAKVPERFAIVIEDMHLLEGDAPALKLVQALIDELPENVRLLLSSRRVPDLKLVDLIASDKVLTIGAEELAFDREELRDLVEARLEGEPDDDLLTALMNETGGWVTGVLLSERLLDPNALPLKGRGEPMSFEYLADNAFERVSKELQDFMLRTAILPYMTCPICDELLEREDSVEHLEELVSRGLFTSVTLNNPRTYEYHHALSQFLRTRAASHLAAEERSALALKAAEVLEAEGQEYTALKILLEAGHEAEAVELGERYSYALYESGRTSELIRVGDRFVESGIAAPSVFVRIANSIGLMGLGSDSTRWIELAESSMEDLDHASKWYLYSSKGASAANSGDIDALERAISMMDELGEPQTVKEVVYYTRACAALASMKASWQRSIDLLTKGKAEIDDMRMGMDEDDETKARNDQSTARILISLGAQLASEARFEESIRATDVAIELLQNQTMRSVLIPLNNQASSLHHSGSYSQSEETFRRAITLSDELEDSYGRAYCHCGYGELLSDLGSFSESLRHLRIAAAHADAIGDNFLLRHIDGQIRLLLYRCPELDDPRIPLQSRDSQNNRLSQNVFTSLVLSADLRGEATQTLQYLDGLDGSAPLNRNEKILLRIWKAILLFRIDQVDDAGHEFFEAMTEATEHNSLHHVAAYLRHEDSKVRLFFMRLAQGQHGHGQLISLMERMNSIAERSEKGFSPLKAGTQKIELQLLGNSALRIEGVSAKIRPRHVAVLAFLTIDGEASKEAIGAAIWPEATKNIWAPRLYTAVYDIRQAIGSDLLLFNSGRYQLDVTKIAIDARQFHTSAIRALQVDRPRLERQILLDASIDLYKGQFYPDCLHEWTISHRGELENLYEEVLQSRAAMSLGEGRLIESLSDLRSLLELNPFRDTAHALYLQVLSALGRRGEIVGHYRRSLALYQRELQIDLPEEVVQTYRTFMR